MSSSNSNGPPPMLATAYESFVQGTPLVTRFILYIQVVSFFASAFLADAPLALGNIPHFTILGFEIYRIMTSPLVNTSLLSLVFAFISFKQHGKRLEHSMGSTAFLWLCIMLGCLTNVLFLVVCFLLYALTGNTTWLFANSSGIWIILFGTITLECTRAPSGSMRRFFVTDIPVLYYPGAVYVVFSLLGGHLIQLDYLISMGLGYLLAKDSWLAKWVLLSSPKAKEWEEGWLASLTQRLGWVVGQASLGSGAWSQDDDSGGGMGINLPLFRQTAPDNNESSSSFTGAGSVFRTGRENQEPSGDNMPSESGRALGGATRRGDARAARLQAVEKRQQQPPPSP